MAATTRRGEDEGEQQAAASSWLDLDRDDLADPEVPDRLHARPCPMSIIRPMRSLNSRFMCSGLMNISATASAAGSASST